MLPNIQPCISQLQQACAARQVIHDVDLVPPGVQSGDVVPESSSHAQPNAAAPIQELSDAFTPPNIFNSQTILKNMPKLDNNLSYIKKGDMPRRHWGRDSQGSSRAGRAEGKPFHATMPGLGALCPRGGWSMIHCDNTCKMILKKVTERK